MEYLGEDSKTNGGTTLYDLYIRPAYSSFVPCLQLNVVLKEGFPEGPPSTWHMAHGRVKFSESKGIGSSHDRSAVVLIQPDTMVWTWHNGLNLI